MWIAKIDCRIPWLPQVLPHDARRQPEQLALAILSKDSVVRHCGYCYGR
jgi:hypothetical protein